MHVDATIMISVQRDHENLAMGEAHGRGVWRACTHVLISASLTLSSWWGNSSLIIRSVRTVLALSMTCGHAGARSRKHARPVVWEVGQAG